MTDLLLQTAIALIVYFGGYWGALYTLVLVNALARGDSAPSEEPDVDRGAVRVLVPSHHEGESLVDTVRTLIDQDYVGEVAVEVLVDDLEDASVAALEQAFGGDATTPGPLWAEAGERARSLRITAVGRREKHAKLNHALEHTKEPFIALLDADHRARASWIRTALTTLTVKDAAGVQCRKRPLAASRLAQVWDAGFSHVAFELFNLASMRSFDGVSFTGSSALFRAEVLTANGFADCITEDTYLSYDLLLAGHRIVYDDRVGSYEEATPNVPSFVFRRRRWSAGHSHAFFAHLPALLRSKASGSTRLLVFVMGQFFLVPVAVALFFALQGAYYFALFTVEVRAVVLVTSAVLALALTLWLSWRRATKLTDFFVCWAVTLPHVSMNGALVYLLSDVEAYYFVTAFPHEAELWLAQAVMLGLALFTFGVGWWRFRPMRPRHALAFVLTAPLVIVFELLAALLGFSDLLLGRREWSRIDRKAEYDQVDEGLRGRLVATTRRVRSRWVYVLYAVPLALAAVVVTNDLLSIGPCGDRAPLLWDPILLSPDGAPVLSVELERRLDGDRLRLLVRARIRPDEEGALDLRVFDGLELVSRIQVPDARSAPTHEVELDWPLGWDTRRIGVSLSGTGRQCVVDRQVPTRVVEARRRGLRVNGEPFVIEGMVTTFSAPGVGLTVDDAYRQMAAIGVNAVRLYHPPTDAIERAARRHHVLLIPQPDGSTWESLDPDSFIDRSLYQRRWRSLVRRTEGDPFVLMLNTGNELEIDDRSAAHLSAIQRLLRRATAVHADGLTTYSSFATYADYPVDVHGINMLDSGPTYWNRALDLVDALEQPFYASEFGGFVAFFESPSTALRQWRLLRQRALLDERGALGVVYFASHDNWSQAVPPGSYNDPFTGDHPDDLRGFWDPNNQPKPELETLTELLAAVDIEVVGPRVAADANEVSVRVHNRRSHRLESVRLELPGDARVWVGGLDPDAARTVRVPGDALRADPRYPDVPVRFSFRSHHGLRGAGRWRMSVPDPSRGPVLVGARVLEVTRPDGALRLMVLAEGQATLLVPDDWQTVRVGNRVIENTGAPIPVRLPGPVYPVTGLEMSSDGQTFVPFDGRRMGEGDRYLRFTLPEGLPGERTLVLSGLAATRVLTRWQDGNGRYPAHPYRETLIDVSAKEGTVTLRFRRRRASYLSASSSPTGEAVPIDVAEPDVFAPSRIEVRRGPR